MSTLMTSAEVVAADATSSTSAWFALGGALGGVLITGALGLATAILNHRWQTRATDQQLRSDHVGRLRQERRETYALYWSAWNGLIHRLQEIQNQVAASTPPGSPAGPAGVPPDTLKAAREAELGWRAAADALFLIAGPPVVKAAEEHLRTTEVRIAAAYAGTVASGRGTYGPLNEAMRNDILDLPAPPNQGSP